MPELVFLRRGEEVLRFSLDRPRVVLGRGDQSDVAIPDPEVSRQQVAVLSVHGEASAEDLSGKGTVVAGQRITHAPLADGADIVLGQWRAVYRARTPTSDDAPATEVRGTTTDRREDTPEERLQAVQMRLRRGSAESVHKFVGETCVLGKDESGDLVLDDRFVSTRHLRITRRGKHFLLVDQGSTNGTWLGPVRIFEAEVPLHSTVRLGETELTFEPASNRREGTQEWHGIIGDDPAVRLLVDLVQRVAPSTAAVAILGESGTGKELVARAIHACSPRVERTFIPVNCAAISKDLIESELFGHEKGAFTGAMATHRGAFEEADGGTLFLDEIGELPLELQAKLLRALESGEIKRVGASRPIHVDVRLVAATNRDLLGLSRGGQFREDLYYRLCVVPLTLPPLRRRRGDIPALAEHFVRQFSPRGQTVHLTREAILRMEAHGWPGNIRELKNVVHRALLLRRGSSIEVTDLSFDPEPASVEGASVSGEFIPGVNLESMLARLERQIIESALRRYSNNRERVARELGVARSTLFKRLKDWGLTRQDETEPS